MAIDLEAEIEAAQERLAKLDRQRELAAARLAELDRLRSTSAPAHAGASQRSPSSKLRLFRDLFQGRQDVFAVRWENSARSRSGYSPRCANEWRPGVCGKPKVRCGACSHQAFVPCDDGQLLAHLQGRQVVGIYRCSPMTPAGYWRSILTAALGARTCTPSPRPVVHSASTPRSSAQDLGTAPTCGSSSPVRSRPPKRAGWAS